MTFHLRFRCFFVVRRAVIAAMIAAGAMAAPLFAEEATQEKAALPAGYLSPDKQWEYRPDSDDKVVILKAGGAEPALDLSDAVPPQFAKEAKLAWAPDSKRFAINYRAGGRWNTTALYQLRDDQWVALRSPENDETYEPLNRAKAAQLKKFHLPKSTFQRRIWDTCTLRSWTDANTAILYAYSDRSLMFNKDLSENDARQDLGDLVAACLFTLKFDARGHWKIIKTHPMTDKEIEKEAAQ